MINLIDVIGQLNSFSRRIRFGLDLAGSCYNSVLPCLPLNGSLYSSFDLLEELDGFLLESDGLMNTTRFELSQLIDSLLFRAE